MGDGVGVPTYVNTLFYVVKWYKWGFVFGIETDQVSLGCPLFLWNGGSLYAPYSLLWISNMLCVWGGGGERVVTLAVVYDPVFRVIIYGPWISQASVT